MTQPAGGAPPPPTGTAPPPAPGGAVTGAVGAYAEWWKRFVAILIDGAILWVVQLIVGGIIGGAASTGIDADTGTVSAGAVTAIIAGNLILLIVGVLYYVLLNGSEKGQTVGKMVMKIAVRSDETGGRAGYGKAFLRYIVGAVLFILCFIPGVVDVLFPLWDPKKQTLHDKAAKTVVVEVG